MMRSIPARLVVSIFSAVAVVIISLLAASSALAITPPPTFTIGEQVATSAASNIRATADGKLLGTQPRFAVGSITAGPATVSGNSVTWYQVSFASGPSGWLGSDMLIGGIAPPKSVVINNGLSQNMTLDEFGDIEVAYVLNVDPDFYAFSESTNQGLSFTTTTTNLPMHTFSAFPFPDGPTIAAERNGAIDIVYVCPPASCPQGGVVPTIQLIRSIDHGATWSAPVQISIPPRQTRTGPSNPTIASCGTGVTVGWLDDGVGSTLSDIINPRDFYVVQVLNGVPGAPLNMSNSILDEQHPQIAVNPQGTVYASWIGVGGVNFAAVPNCAAVQQ